MPANCTLPEVQFIGDIGKKSLRDGYELMFVAFIKRSVSSNGVHSVYCIIA